MVFSVNHKGGKWLIGKDKRAKLKQILKGGANRRRLGITRQQGISEVGNRGKLHLNHRLQIQVCQLEIQKWKFN